MRIIRLVTLLYVLLVCCAGAFAQDSLNVSHVGEMAYWDLCNDVLIESNLAYAATGFAGLRIMNVSDPQTPEELGYYCFDGAAYGLVYKDGLVLIAGMAAGLRIIDVSDSRLPVEIGSIESIWGAREVAIQDDYAYVIGMTPSLAIVDIQNPAVPALCGTFNSLYAPKGITVSGDYAYIADSWNGFQIVRVSDPANMLLIGEHDTDGEAEDVVVDEGYAYVASDGGLEIFDIANPEEPQRISFLETVHSAKGITLVDTVAFVSCYTYGLWVVNVSDPYTPSVLDHFATDPGWAYNTAVSGDVALHVGPYLGMIVLDISDLSSLMEIGNYNQEGLCLDVDISGDYAFTANQFGGIKVTDITDPSAPSEVAFNNQISNSSSIRIAGDYAYVACGSEGFYILNISDPLNPDIVGHNANSAYNVTVSDSLAFVPAATYGMYIYDISNPALPDLLNTYSPAEVYQIKDAAVQDNLIILSCGYDGLCIADFEDPAAPVEISALPITAWTVDSEIAGDYAYVACWNAGLKVVDISNPYEPVVIGGYNTPSAAAEIRLFENHAFVADMMGGVRVIDIRNPGIPLEVGYYTTRDNASGIATDGTKVYLAEFHWLGIYDVSQAVPVIQAELPKSPNEFRLHSPYPNPANPFTKISFNLPYPQKAELAVYNLLGQKVATLASGHQMPGQHTCSWNASEQSSGVYFIWLKTDLTEAVQRVTVTK